jgi:hypothetical protein
MNRNYILFFIIINVFVLETINNLFIRRKEKNPASYFKMANTKPTRERAEGIPIT